MSQYREDPGSRPLLTSSNSEKVRKLSNELHMSESEIVNRIIASVSVFELTQVITFVVDVRGEDDNQTLTRKARRRSHRVWRIPL